MTTLDKTQYAYMLTLDHAWHVTANTGDPNAYWAADADTLATWLLAGHRVTCPSDGALIDRVRVLVAERRG